MWNFIVFVPVKKIRSSKGIEFWKVNSILNVYSVSAVNPIIVSEFILRSIVDVVEVLFSSAMVNLTAVNSSESSKVACKYQLILACVRDCDSTAKLSTLIV